jgi:hypothetical protein
VTPHHNRDPNEPGYRPPALRRRPTVGEQQCHVHQQSVERYPQPGDDPGRDLSTRQRVGLDLLSVDGVLVAKVVQPRNESCPAEQPAYGVLGAAGKDEKPECREGHRNDRLLDPGAVDVHVRVGTIEGEQEEGERQERNAEYPERPC